MAIGRIQYGVATHHIHVLVRVNDDVIIIGLIERTLEFRYFNLL